MGKEDTDFDSLEVSFFAKKALEEGIPFNKINLYLSNHNPNNIVKVRARMLELQQECDLSHLKGKPVDFKEMQNRGFKDENYIGTIQVPVGAVGPVKIKKARHLERPELTYLLATTERSLIAGANAGAKIINQAGGVEVQAYTETNLIARSSAFVIREFTRIPEYMGKIKLLLADHETIEAVIRDGYGPFRGSEHARFVSAELFSEDDYLYIRYNIDPGDAAGHNMVTKIAFVLNNYLMEELKKKDLPLEHLILSGGLCKDKNAAAINLDRGIKFQARVTVPYNICRQFGIDPEKTEEASFVKNYLGQSIAGGLRGNNSSIANPYTAMAIAYGQDAANAIEASQARTVIKNRDETLHYSVNGNILCGTLGGGTEWPCQREALEMLGVYGSDPEHPGLYKARFAEAVAVAFLLSEVAVHRSLMTGEEGLGSRHFKSHNGKMRKQ